MGVIFDIDIREDIIDDTILLFIIATYDKHRMTH